MTNIQTIYLLNGKTEYLYGEREQQGRLLYDILYEYLGRDIAQAFQRLLTKEDEYGDNYELIADGYRNALIDTMNDLHEVLYGKNRISRKRLEEIHDRLNKEV